MDWQPQNSTPRTSPETIRALAAAIDRMLAWQLRRHELKESAKYRRSQKREAAA
jgi:hypothetical protein